MSINRHEMIIDGQKVVRHDIDNIQPILDKIKTARTIFAAAIWGFVMNSCHPQMNTNWYLQDISSVSITDQERAGNKKFFKDFNDGAELIGYIGKKRNDIMISEIEEINQYVLEVWQITKQYNAINWTEQEMLESKQERLKLEEERAITLNSKKEKKPFVVKVLDKAAGTIGLAFAWITMALPEILWPKKERRKTSSVPRVAQREEDIVSSGNPKIIRRNENQELETSTIRDELPIRRDFGDIDVANDTIEIPKKEVLIERHFNQFNNIFIAIAGKQATPEMQDRFMKNIDTVLAKKDKIDSLKEYISNIEETLFIFRIYLRDGLNITKDDKINTLLQMLYKELKNNPDLIDQMSSWKSTVLQAAE